MRYTSSMAGQFHGDLLVRLSALSLALPPLRPRPPGGANLALRDTFGNIHFDAAALTARGAG